MRCFLAARARRAAPHSAASWALPFSWGCTGALVFSILTDGGKQTRAVATFLPETDEVLYWTGLRIEQVALSGQRFTADADVFDAIDLPNAGSLATFNAAQARDRIENLPWVSTATISRIFPGSLEVRITERQPAALWLNDDREYLVDDSGRVLSALKKGTKVRLPRLSGEGAPEQAQSLLELIVRFPRIAERFEMAERVGGRRWTLHLKDRVVVHLGADREAVAFAALSSPDELGKLLDTARRRHRFAHAGARHRARRSAARIRNRHTELVEGSHAEPRQDRQSETRRSSACSISGRARSPASSRRSRRRSGRARPGACACWASGTCARAG